MAALFPAKLQISGAASSRRRENLAQCNSNRRRLSPATLSPLSQIRSADLRGRRWSVRATISPFSAAAFGGGGEEKEDSSMSIALLRRFFELNSGKWNGSFYQFDPRGTLLQNVDTRLSASSYGEEELISLIQTLYIKQAPSRTITPDDDDEPEWVEYKIKETNMFTADKYQQIGFFPEEKAFSLRYQTAGMLETVLRAGVLGEDDTGEESPRNLMLPSRRPAIVCENCLNSIKGDLRARAFHVVDPKGIPEMFLIFLEGKRIDKPDLFSIIGQKGADDRVNPFLGQWKGRSLTKRSGIYGSTISVADVTARLEMDDHGRLTQDITTTASRGGSATKVNWTGELSGNIAIFEGAYQLTFLPGGMYVGCPCDISKCVAEMQSFHVEFCWMESESQRQRLIRTYDSEGLPVSSAHFLENKI